MSEQPTRDKFRKSLTSGGDMGKITLPTPIKLVISSGGMTTHAAQQAIQKNKNLENEWNVLESEANVHQAKERAHGAAYKALAAEIGAATEFHGSREAYWKLDTAKANELIAHTERDVKIASIPMHQAKFKAELETLAVQVQEIELELKKITGDFEHNKVMNELNGYDTEITLPKLQMPKFDSLKLEGGNANQ